MIDRELGVRKAFLIDVRLAYIWHALHWIDRNIEMTIKHYTLTLIPDSSSKRLSLSSAEMSMTS